MRISSYRSVLAFVGMLLSAGAASAQIGQEFQILQIPFIENKGQVDEQVRFYANTFAGTVFVTDKGEIVYSLTKEEEIVIKEIPGSPKESELKGINKAETKVNYFVGAKDEWRTNIPTWQEVSIGEVYEGIELKLIAYGNNVEKLFTVHPQGSVSDINLKIEGAKGLTVNKDGALEIETEFGTVKFTKPVAYQEINGKRVEVAVAYTISQSEYGFQVGDYDRGKTLTIDPTLVYSTYLGGSRIDHGQGIAVDSSGNIYVSGTTNSTNFPTTASAYQENNSGDMDIYITKINPSGTGLVYSTYLGGSSKDSGCGNIALDSSGNVYATGYTYSTDFPTTESAFDRSYAGNKEAFITKINPSGTGLVYSTYLGGSGDEYPCGWSIAVDSSGNAYVVGQTNSTDFPTTASAYQENKLGGKDAFVTKINPSGSGLVYSTYLGGGSDDGSWSIALDSSGNAYMGGYTKSTDFPTTASAYQEDYGEDTDAFITKINPSGTGLVYSTYLGGNGTDYGHAIAVDSSGNAYATGRTTSSNFPTASPLQGSYGEDTDAFVTKINASGSGLVYSTYLGGGAYDYGWGFAADSFGNAYISGYTKSTDFPTESPIQENNAGGGKDGFVTKINPSGSLVFSTYLGGNATDNARDIDVDSSGNAYIAGITNSTDFPTESPLYGNYLGGGFDIFVTKMDLAPPHITIDSPLNQTYNQTQIWANVTLNENASWCGYSLNGTGNVTMTQSNSTYYYASVPAPSGSNNITFYCNDTVGSMSNRTVYFTVDMTQQITTYNISLNAGWNLISIPLEQSNWSITSVLASIEGKYTVVFEYSDGGWKRSTAPRIPLTDMSLQYGYWINMTESATLTVSGQVPSVTTMNVDTGWNLVGHPSITAQNLTIVLSPINYTVVFEYSDGGWKRSTAPRVPLTHMAPGYGYWVNTTGAGSYEV